MSKIDEKHYGFLPLGKYVYTDKEKNVQTYIKYMLNRSLAMFKYHDLPETIPEDELEKLLQGTGSCVWYQVDDQLYVFNASLGGEPDVYNRPTKAIITNSALRLNTEATINEDCIIMYNDSMSLGLIPMYMKYCSMINEVDISIIMATINKRIQILLSASDDSTVESAKQFIKNVEDGKIGVIAENRLFESLKTNAVASQNTKTLQDLFELQQYLKASMYNEIGLNANWNSKRERLLNNEVLMNSDNLYPLVDDMLKNRKQALEKINTMFDTNISVEFNSSWDYRLYNGVSIHNTDDEIIVDDQEHEDTSNQHIIDYDMEQDEPLDDIIDTNEPKFEQDEPLDEPDRTNEEPTEEPDEPDEPDEPELKEKEDNDESE